MNGIDAKIKECAEAFVPTMSEGYTKMVADTLEWLKSNRVQAAEPKRRLWKPFAAAAAAVLALFVSAAAVIAARPALAAEIPGVSGIVYAAAPQKEASDVDRVRLEKLIESAFNSLILGKYDEAARCFRKGCMTERGNYLAAQYLYMAFNDYDENGGVRSEVTDREMLDIEDFRTEQKAFSFTVHFTLDVVSIDEYKREWEQESVLHSPECTVSVWENRNGMYIERIELHGEEYQSFADDCERLINAAPSGEQSFELIPIDAEIIEYIRFYSLHYGVNYRLDMLNRISSDLDALSASDEDKAVRRAIIQTELEKANAETVPENKPYEDLAAEIIRRWHLCRVHGEEVDFSDIMERNENTDAFLISARDQADAVALGVLLPYESAHSTAELIEVIEETDEFITAKFDVSTRHPYFAGEGAKEELIDSSSGFSITLTVRRDGDSLTVIAYDMAYGDGFGGYSTVIKPRIEKLKAQGCSWEEAGRIVSGELHEQNLAFKEWQENEAKKTPQERMRESAVSIADELMYQYRFGCKIGRASDFFDLGERTEKTDLFIWDMRLAAESAELGLADPIESVEYGGAEIVEIIEETEKSLTARVRVYTYVNGKKLEQQIVIALKYDAVYPVIGFEDVSESCLFTKELKQLSDTYKQQGLSWQEAGQRAYDEIHARLVREANA